jgi:hypothetical protein
MGMHLLLDCLMVCFYTLSDRGGGDAQWRAVKNAEQRRRPKKRRQRKNKIIFHAAGGTITRRFCCVN